MLKKLVIIIPILTAFLLSVNIVKAQGPTSTPIPGWGKETNIGWSQICSNEDASPYISGFDPADFELIDLSQSTIDLYPNEFYLNNLTSLQTPSTIQEEGGTSYTYSPQCFWKNTVGAAALGLDTSLSPSMTFSHDIEYGDVTFLYSYKAEGDYAELLWRNFKIKVLWDDGFTTTEVDDYFSYQHNCDFSPTSPWQNICVGWINTTIDPQNGRKIERIYVEFPQTIYVDIPGLPIGNVLNWAPAPILKIDNLLIRGFYQLNPSTPTPTITPAATATPTGTRTPTVTTTPRNLWDTPTVTPTGVFTPTATPTGIPTKLFDWVFKVPTKIPAIRLPAWPTPPTVVLLPPTPSSLFSLPLIPTPAPISPTSTLVPLNLSIVLTYPTFAAFVAPTETATPLPTGTPGASCVNTDFSTLSSLPAGWTVSSGAFTPLTGLSFGVDGSDKRLTLHNTADGTFTSFYLATTQTINHSFSFTITGDISASGIQFINQSREGYNLTLSGFDLNFIFPNTSDEIILKDFNYCFTPTSPTATPTFTPSPTRDDIVASLSRVNATLSAEAAWMTTPTTFTIQTAPITYAEHLPRPFANVGYTFENMQGNIGFMYDPRAWASLFGYIIGLPIAMVKFLYTLAGLMGPVGMFVTWLLILLPFTLWIKLALFIKNLIITIINLIIKLIQFIGDLWDLIPFG